MKIKKYNLIKIILLGTFINVSVASHHFESALAKENPEYDLTDTYVFDSKDKKSTVFIIDANPKTKKDGSTSFGNNGIYNFHIANNKTLTSGITITVTVSDDTLSFGMLDSANPKIGEVGNIFGKSEIGKENTFENGVRVWAGAARDPFVGNSAGLRAFRANFDKGIIDDGVFSKGIDLFEKFNTSAIVIEVPNNMLPNKLYYYATSAMYDEKNKSWVQINRIANVLMTHLFIYNNKTEVNEHVHHRPDSDGKRSKVIYDNVLKAVSINKSKKDAKSYAKSVVDKLIPDMIPYKVGTKAEYSFKKINGRNIKDDAMDTVLSIFLGKEFTDNANTFNRHSKDFPYLKKIK